jgi:signal peptidase I
VVISGVIALFDLIFLAKKRKEAHALRNKNIPNPPAIKLPILIDYAWSFFPVLLLVFVLRSFLFEPFRIPSGSLEPTLSIGDFILVNKYHYGIRLPVVHKEIYPLYKPQRGDIIVFRWPPNPSVDFIKRVIGVPGDRISYIDKTLYINGTKIPQEFVADTTRRGEAGDVWDIVEKKENLLGVVHSIYQNKAKSNDDFENVLVPPGMFFAMGDNRDDSGDSRIWGFVPEENIVGKANYVWMSWDSDKYKIRFKRIGQKII